MKWRNKILISLSLIPLLLLSVFLSAVIIPTKANDSSGYTQKVVAVVYDDSGSMADDSFKKQSYAKYAMQTLMSVLDSKDLLTVFALNQNDNADTSRDYSLSVDLTADDRNQVVQNAIADKSFGASGKTPPDALKKAVTWLATNGLNKDEVVENKEFWLIVLSDGEFDNKATVSTGQNIKNAIDGYVGLQTAYFGICVNDGMKIDKLVAENSAVSAYYTDTAEEIIDAMEQITNRTTGRYTMEEGVSKDGTGKVYELDLSTCGFSVVSVGVLAQGSGDSVELNNVKGVTVDGAVLNVQKLRPCSMSVNHAPVHMSGSSVMLTPINDSGYFNGDKLTLEFNTAPESVTILLEPAIKLQSTLQYNDGSGWVDVDEEYVNSTLKKGANVRARYKLLDKMSGKDLTSILTNVTTTVSYNGKINDYEQGFTLETGKKEVSLSVKVDISGSVYTLYNSWLCDIDENPTYFRIEGKTVNGYGGNVDKIKSDFTIYYDNVKVKKSDFEGTVPKLSWKFLGITDPFGNEITPETYELNNDGTITVIYNTSVGQYGGYVAKIKVTCTENKRSRTSSQEFKFYPSQVSAVVGEITEQTLTQNQLKTNDQTFEFTLTANSYPINFDSGVIGYKLLVDGIDLTSSAIIDGNVLRFIPNVTNLTGSLINIGDKKIQLDVWSENNPSVKGQAEVLLKVTKPLYTVEPIKDKSEVDIYNIAGSGAKVYFKASIDGVVLTKEELEQGLADKSIKIETNPFGWALLLPVAVVTRVEEINGQAVICLAVESDYPSFLENLFASLIFTGDKTVSVNYGDATGESQFNLLAVSFISRLWRVVVIVLSIYTIVHIILWLIGFAVAKSLPKGVMVKLVLNQALPAQQISYSTKAVNIDGNEKLKWHLTRLIPFKEFMNQKPVSLYGCVQLNVNENRERRITMLKTMHEVIVLADEEDKTYLEYIEYKRKWRKYEKGSRKPRLEITTKKLNYLLEDRDKEYKAKRSVGVGETCFATKDEKGRITMIVFFIQTK